MKIKAKDILRQSQLDMDYLKDIGTTVDALAKVFQNPVFAQFKPVLDKLSTDYKDFLNKQQQSQAAPPTTPTTLPTAPTT